MSGLYRHGFDHDMQFEEQRLRRLQPRLDEGWQEQQQAQDEQRERERQAGWDPALQAYRAKPRAA